MKISEIFRAAWLVNRLDCLMIMLMIDQTPFGANVEFVENPEPRCPCVLVLDVSSSMDGDDPAAKVILNSY